MLMSNPSAQPVKIILSILLAMILSILPLPGGLEPYRPEWVALILIYWTRTLPAYTGIGVAWCTGLLLDVLHSALLGQHALALCVIAYLSMRTHLLVRVYPVFQQAIVVGLMLVLYQSVILWVNGVLGEDSDTTLYWAPTLSSMLFWPVIVMIMRLVRRDLSAQ